MDRNLALIEAAELLETLDDPNLRIFDATVKMNVAEGEPDGYGTYQAGHIPGAAFFDHQRVSDKSSKYMLMIPPQDTLNKAIGDLGINPDSRVIVYATDMIGWATRAWWVLRYAGHTNVRVLNGGLKAWSDAGGGMEAGVNTYAEASFTGQLRANMFANKEEVQAVLGDGSARVSYTLPKAAYGNNGITGSTCLPCTNLLDEWRTLLPNDKLAEQLSEQARDRVITYCGGGVAATVNAMAHLLIGNENVAVYDGSFSEWSGEGLPISEWD